MAAAINNFELKSISKEEIPHLQEFDTIDDYQIYRSTFNTSYFTIYDHEYEVYRVLEFQGKNDLELQKNIRLYLEKYYKNLTAKEKSTLTPK